MIRDDPMKKVAFKSMKPKSIKFAAMTIHEANKRLLFQLYELYDNREAANIADLVMENITGWKRIDRIVNKEVKLSAPMEEMLDRYTKELLTHKPVQYVLNEAWFGDMKFFVNEHVLIPRPETEELADLAVKEMIKNKKSAGQIIDIGTGSGCIPIYIKKKLPAANVHAIDVSEEALNVAKRNATENNTAVNFALIDILNEHEWNHLPSFDLIISNPPYIPLSEKNEMPENVTGFEPHLALFVDDKDPLIFYKAIAGFAEKMLSSEGKVFVELHENLSESTAAIFNSFETEIKKDMQGKDRFLIAKKKNK
jgi:release factor glutamine methyltransferase